MLPEQKLKTFHERFSNNVRTMAFKWAVYILRPLKKCQERKKRKILLLACFFLKPHKNSSRNHIYGGQEQKSWEQNTWFPFSQQQPKVLLLHQKQMLLRRPSSPYRWRPPIKMLLLHTILNLHFLYKKSSTFTIVNLIWQKM